MITTLDKLSVHLWGEDISIPDIGKMQHLMVFSYVFFGFKRIPIHQLTQNLSFNIHFHLYIYDHDFEQTFGTFT